MQKLLNAFDGETARVWTAATASIGLTLAQVNTFLTTIVLIGSIIYTWRKVLRGKKTNDEEDK